MKTSRQIQINIALTLIGAIAFSVATATSILTASQPSTSAAQTSTSLTHPSQVVVITAKKWSVAEKLHYDALAAVGAVGTESENKASLEVPAQVVVISAKRLNKEEKIAFDAARARQLQANTQYNTLLRKTV